ncbi:uncharacterized protein BDR25DRAFT_366683 [Lindgomyces ingoldianus]|uniref:Uncharacterized protein n=1 Tax=Lindgomyces ingoldianus TaxID=673940 RepID=A0ACB6QY06_9PLEO|nr:uncharacterized protein BDR25DRAFT_366683 [Lindgomyces ingoldianus]KAF2471934.1 hypothetical protein BDR25DRAFT_366683 [Lindgomyces ingoldianus]
MPPPTGTLSAGPEEAQPSESTPRSKDLVEGPKINPSGMHLLRDRQHGLSLIEDILRQLPEDLRDILEGKRIIGTGFVWICIPRESAAVEKIPLAIAGIPVVVPVEYRYPLISLTIPPPYPHTHFIDCSKPVDEDIVDGIFETYEDALGFYLINGMLQIIVPNDFDYEYAVPHKPNTNGNLKARYIPQGVISTEEKSDRNPDMIGLAQSTATI